MKTRKYLLTAFLAAAPAFATGLIFFGAVPHAAYAAEGTTSQLTGVTMPRGGTTYSGINANFSHLLSGLAKEKVVALQPTDDELEVFGWQGDAYREDRVAFTKSGLTAALKAAGYQVEQIDEGELRDVNIFASFDSNDEQLAFHPSVTKRSSYFKASNAAAGKALIGAWLESDDALVLGLFPVAFKAAPVAKPLPPVPAGAFLVKDIDNTMKGMTPPKPPTFAPMAPKPRTVRGVAKDGAGKPIPNVQVAVYSSVGGGVRTTHKARTDAQGVYEVLLPAGVGEVAEAKVTVSYNGQKYDLGLAPVSGEFKGFDIAKGHVENLVLSTSGTSGGTIRLLDNVDSGTVEVTLTPIGKLMDGSTGRTLVYRYGADQSETYLNGMPLGRYKLTARLLDDGEALPLRVRKTFGDDDELKDELQVDFEPGYTFSQVNYNKSNHDVAFFQVTLEP